MSEGELPSVVVRPGQPFISCPHCHATTATGAVAADRAEITCSRCGARVVLVVDRPKG